MAKKSNVSIYSFSILDKVLMALCLSQYMASIVCNKWQILPAFTFSSVQQVAPFNNVNEWEKTQQ